MRAAKSTEHRARRVESKIDGKEALEFGSRNSEAASTEQSVKNLQVSGIPLRLPGFRIRKKLRRDNTEGGRISGVSAAAGRRIGDLM